MRFKQRFIFITIIVLNATGWAGEFTNHGRVLFQEAATWVPANKVCTSGENLFHKKLNYVEKISCSGAEGDNCKVFKRVPLVQPINSMRIRCVRSSREGCVQYESVDFDQPIKVRSDVFGSFKEFQENQRPLRSKWFEISNCK